jgi:tripartite-type tricarboxylate transporter receptor subunit TctC
MAGAIGAAVVPMWSRPCLAFQYPVRPARIVVGFPPGSSSDIVARLVAQSLSERLAHQFIVDNRPGASGNIAVEYVAKAIPDGYTPMTPAQFGTFIADDTEKWANVVKFAHIKLD